MTGRNMLQLYRNKYFVFIISIVVLDLLTIIIIIIIIIITLSGAFNSSVFLDRALQRLCGNTMSGQNIRCECTLM
jgi:hypothetical protein